MESKTNKPSIETSPTRKKLTGALRAPGKVAHSVARDARTVESAKRLSSNINTVAKTAAGIAVEYYRDPKVRKVVNEAGTRAVVGFGIAVRDESSRATKIKVRDAISAVGKPKQSTRGAIEATRSIMPEVRKETSRATPDAFERYAKKNPGAIEAATKATGNIAKDIVVFPAYVSVAALRAISDIRHEGAATIQESTPQDAPSSDSLVVTVTDEGAASTDQGQQTTEIDYSGYPKLAAVDGQIVARPAEVNNPQMLHHQDTAG